MQKRIGLSYWHIRFLSHTQGGPDGKSMHFDRRQMGVVVCHPEKCVSPWARALAIEPPVVTIGPTLGVSGFARGLPVAVGLCSQMVGFSFRTQSVCGVAMGLELLGARLGL